MSAPEGLLCCRASLVQLLGPNTAHEVISLHLNIFAFLQAFVLRGLRSVTRIFSRRRLRHRCGRSGGCGRWNWTGEGRLRQRRVALRLNAAGRLAAVHKLGVNDGVADLQRHPRDSASRPPAPLRPTQKALQIRLTSPIFRVNQTPATTTKPRAMDSLRSQSTRPVCLTQCTHSSFSERRRSPTAFLPNYDEALLRPVLFVDADPCLQALKPLSTQERLPKWSCRNSSLGKAKGVSPTKKPHPRRRLS